ncbi:hypothetical protein N7535_002737 [Penicillium sp. DV-2018c]|nr:hypothetical protein N7461_001577 [Penicillium sp. DV-2018c]KAJ5575811.1 hypothetical protein N7535_002737 [Penicillium sp. DV-2018c]
MASTATKSPTEKLSDSMKGLVIGASGIIPGYPHDRIKKMVEECGAKFTTTDLDGCTHLVTTEISLKRRLKKITEAREQGSCKIVSIDWLLRSTEKHTPVSVDEYLVTPNTKIRAKQLEKKRARSVSPAGEDCNSLKKQKEQHLPLQYLIDLVPEAYPETSDGGSVWQDAEGVVWDATLVYHCGSMWNLTVLRVKIPDQRSHTWAFQYEGSYGAFGSLDSAKHAFETEFERLCGLPWKDRYDLPLEDRCIFVETHHRD